MLSTEETREQPDGEDEDSDELDPRVEIELEKLNTASNDINILEKELDEARSLFRQRLTDAARNLKALAKEIGNHIDKARPYFEAVTQSKKAQLECQNAAATFERACQLHKGAREAIAVAEDKLRQNPGMFDAAWQEMLNNANLKIMEAERDKLYNENLHHEAAIAYQQLEERVARLEKQLRKSINKAKPYFHERAEYMGYLESQKIKVQELEKSYDNAKKQYSSSLQMLEEISEEIHKKRKREHHPHSTVNTPSRKREECIGAESINKSPSRRKSSSRKYSEDRIKQVLAQKRYASGRFRSSLLLDLDVDFDIEDSLDGNDPLKSPSSKSVDIGCVQMNYYNDFQVLDVAPFLKRDRSLSDKQINTSKMQNRVPSPKKARPQAAAGIGSAIVNVTTDMLNSDLHNMQLHNTDNDNTFISRDISGVSRKESRLVLINKFTKIPEDKIVEESIAELPENIEQVSSSAQKDSQKDISVSDTPLNKQLNTNDEEVQSNIDESKKQVSSSSNESSSANVNTSEVQTLHNSIDDVENQENINEKENNQDSNQTNNAEENSSHVCVNKDNDTPRELEDTQNLP